MQFQTDDPIGQGIHSGTIKAAILVACNFIYLLE